MTQNDLTWRGLTTGGLVAIIVGAVAILGIGFVLGRATSGYAIVDTKDDTSQTTTVAEVASATPRSTTTPGTPGTTHQHAGQTPPERAIARADELPADAPFGFDPPALDFGIVPINKELIGSFTLTNRTKTELHLLAMKPDCKCTTVADLTGTRIKPGDSVTVEPVIDGRTYPGIARSEIVFLFEGHEPVRYTIKSDVSRAVRTEPAFIQLEADEEAGILTVQSIDGRPFRVLAVDQGEPPYADSFDSATDAPRESYTLAWDMSVYDPETCTDANGREMPDYWVIETDHPEAPILDVRVRDLECTLPEGYGNRRWILKEQRIVLDEIPAGESREFTVDVLWYRDQKPSDTIASVESLSDAFSASLLPLEVEDDVITCRVRVTPDPNHRGLIYGEVQFYAMTPGHAARMIVIARVVDPEPQTASAGLP